MKITRGRESTKSGFLGTSLAVPGLMALAIGLTGMMKAPVSMVVIGSLAKVLGGVGLGMIATPAGLAILGAVASVAGLAMLIDNPYPRPI